MCKRCAELLAKPARALVLFEQMYMDRCPTPLWYEREGERIRSLAIIEHARAGHPPD